MSPDTEKQILDSLETYRAYTRVLLDELAKASDLTDPNKGVWPAWHAFGIADDALALCLNKTISSQSEMDTARRLIIGALDTGSMRTDRTRQLYIDMCRFVGREAD